MISDGHQRFRATGFTLIELLVVVFLIGLISGFAVLSVSFHEDDRDITQTLKALRYRLILAAEESVVQGRPIGVHFSHNRYQFLSVGLSEWHTLNSPRALLPNVLQQGWHFRLVVAKQPLPLDKERQDSSDKPDKKLLPHIIFHISGEVDPFELLVEKIDGPGKFRIWLGEDGVIALEAINES